MNQKITYGLLHRVRDRRRGALAIGLAGVICACSAPAEIAKGGVAATQMPASSESDELRDRVADEKDLAILERADAILAEESLWNHVDDRQCPPNAAHWSLFCALEKASLDVVGEYQHRRVALQEVRFAIEDVTNHRQFAHRMMDFNNLQDTRFADIKHVLEIAIARVRARLPSQHTTSR